MTAVYASTSPEWFANLTVLAPRPDEVAFWRPTYSVPSEIAIGEPWFFKQWKAPWVLGFGRFVRDEGCTVSDLWRRYGLAAGAQTERALLEAITAARQDRPTTLGTEIGNVVLSDFTPFAQPVSVTDLDLPRLPGPFRYVPAGNRILDLAVPHAMALERALAEAAADEEAHGDFNPTNIEDARKKVMASIVRRQGQGKFRRELLAAYEGRCAISNCAVPELLEAAHIHPYLGAETNDVRNGILLRTDLHTLFDLGLLAIDAKNWTVLISQRLSDSSYGQFAGRKFRRPRERAHQPNVEALIRRRAEAGL